MDTHLIIFILSIAGLFESIYLNYECRKNRAPVCLVGDQCSVVWDSPYSKTFGVSNEILGLIYYATLAVVEYSIFLGDTTLQMMKGEMIILVGGAVMSCYFFYVQWRLIKAWCFWCTFSAIIVWMMLAVRLLL